MYTYYYVFREFLLSFKLLTKHETTIHNKNKIYSYIKATRIISIAS